MINFISNNKILLYKYTGTYYNITALDISNFSEKFLYRTEENIYDYRSDNFWLKNGNLYYYNKPGYNDKDQITLFSFDAFFNAFYPVVTESLSAGVDRKHKLIKLKDKIYLCTNDLYEIEGQTYTKINGKKLLPLLLYFDSYYKIENEKIIYAEENGNNKDIYVVANGIKFKIFTKEKSYSIKEISTFGNYLFIVDWMDALFMVDVTTQSMEVLEDRIDYLPGLKPVFEDGKYLFYLTFQGLHLYNPDTKTKKLLSAQSLYTFYPFMIFNGKTHLIFSDKICVLDDNLNLVVLPSSDDYDVIYQGAIQDDNLFYFIARQNNTYFLFKFDGVSSTKILRELNFIFHLSVRISWSFQFMINLVYSLSRRLMIIISIRYIQLLQKMMFLFNRYSGIKMI
ncbi:MAG: hypothetical protein IPG79_04550 [Saprospiraceae bacterium]|nr:hypothetical protein [Saprospiraceae bacterium]